MTAEQPAARILLSGEEAAVRAAALLIAGAIAAEVPVASLAAEAIGLATGRAPKARHRGAPVLPDAEIGVPEALAHIIGHLTDVVLAYAPLADRLDDGGRRGGASDACGGSPCALRDVDLPAGR